MTERLASARPHPLRQLGRSNRGGAPGGLAGRPPAGCGHSPGPQGGRLHPRVAAEKGDAAVDGDNGATFGRDDPDGLEGNRLMRVSRPDREAGWPRAGMRTISRVHLAPRMHHRRRSAPGPTHIEARQASVGGSTTPRPDQRACPATGADAALTGRVPRPCRPPPRQSCLGRTIRRSKSAPAIGRSPSAPPRDGCRERGCSSAAGVSCPFRSTPGDGAGGRRDWPGRPGRRACGGRRRRVGPGD